MTTAPDLLILGQATHDHVVPAAPAPWRPQMGGNALYAAAGARLALAPERLGVVTRKGRGYPFAIEAVLAEAGVTRVAVTSAPVDHLVEWLLYEADGSRRALPRNPELRGAGGEGVSAQAPYLERLEAISPAAEDVPGAWRAAPAVYLAPQVEGRHRASVRAFALRGAVITVDPSPHYSRHLDATGLGELLAGAHALLASEQEVGHLLDAHNGPAGAARALLGAGFAEVVIKLGARGAWVAAAATETAVAAVQVRVADPTGAGDAFGGAYAAARVSGLGPVEAAAAGTRAGGMAVEVTGADATLTAAARASGFR